MKRTLILQVIGKKMKSNLFLESKGVDDGWLCISLCTENTGFPFTPLSFLPWLGCAISITILLVSFGIQPLPNSEHPPPLNKLMNINNPFLHAIKAPQNIQIDHRIGTFNHSFI